MKFINLQRKASSKKGVIVDFYQRSIEKMGRDQIQKMVDRGISMPVVML